MINEEKIVKKVVTRLKSCYNLKVVTRQIKICDKNNVRIVRNANNVRNESIVSNATLLNNLSIQKKLKKT